MPKFILLLTGSGDYATFSPAQNEAALKVYMEWTQKLHTDGSFLHAERLSGQAKTIHPGPNPEVTDGPFAESKEAVAGYYAITAADFDDATKIALGCPHTQYGGYVQVHGVYEMK